MQLQIEDHLLFYLSTTLEGFYLVVRHNVWVVYDILVSLYRPEDFTHWALNIFYVELCATDETVPHVSDEVLVAYDF